MPRVHLILLANFYGSYLDKSRFKAVAIVNNAGIEQLATLGRFKANVTVTYELFYIFYGSSSAYMYQTF